MLSRNSPINCGYFAKDRWQDAKGNKAHEISLNPTYLVAATDIEICQTLVHEMVHLWQEVFGKPARTGYHNKQWAYKMKAVGLMPSHTGRPGGKEVGQQMADYPMEGGLFEKAFHQMPKDMLLPFKSYDRFMELAVLAAAADGHDTITLDGEVIPVADIPRAPVKKRYKVKYTCPTCRANAWGKPELGLVCQDCLAAYLLVRGTIGGEALELFVMEAQEE